MSHLFRAFRITLAVLLSIVLILLAAVFTLISMAGTVLTAIGVFPMPIYAGLFNELEKPSETLTPERRRVRAFTLRAIKAVLFKRDLLFIERCRAEHSRKDAA